MPLDFIERIVEDTDDDTRAKAIAQLTSPSELCELAQRYNWDEGMFVPTLIADHPLCEIGTSLRLFELSQAISWLSDKRDWTYQEEWVDFCAMLTSRIVSGHYGPPLVTYQPNISKFQMERALKANVPSIFLTPIAESDIQA